MYSVPLAPDRWNEIVPNLFQGGHDYSPPGSSWYSEDVRVAGQFRLVISLYHINRTLYGPGPGVRHIIDEVPDRPLDTEQRDRLRGLAGLAVEAVMDGHPTLVRCQAGYNRSGLVVGLALLQMGYTAGQAVARIRGRRSPHALCNPAFVTYLHEEAAR